jgi:serine/threonine protein kinase
MGVVYRAEQESPVRRIVAIKLIRLGLETREVLARFDSERQALAVMNHPNIARVLDVGTTAGGRPFFAMDFIDGVPITAHCDERRLGIAERLRLFLQVCEGIQHAHQNAVIHRDLKPSNVLVTIRDGHAVPVIIDFGVAKAVHNVGSGRPPSQCTAFGQFLGTPDYMSPEQASDAGGGVDTRTDVYSLGVLLHELLTGMLPLDLRSRSASSLETILATIRTVDPTRPRSPRTSSGTCGNSRSPRDRPGASTAPASSRGATARASRWPPQRSRCSSPSPSP